MYYNIAFARLEQLLPFLHVVFVIMFVSIQTSICLLGRHAIKKNSKSDYAILLSMIKSKTPFVFIALFGVICIGGIMTWSYKKSIDISDPMAEALLATKIALWVFIMLNCIYMLYHSKKAYKFFIKNDLIQTNESLVLIVYYFIPLNLIISILAVYLGFSYRSFI